MPLDVKKFKIELAELLGRHGASLYFNVDGDTHGICNEEFRVYDNTTRQQHKLSSEGNYYLDAGDLNED